MSQKLLHANVFGEGKPLFILHGFLGMGDNWKTLGKQFAKDGYQVHLIDQRNHGRSFQRVDQKLIQNEIITLRFYFAAFFLRRRT